MDEATLDQSVARAFTARSWVPVAAAMVRVSLSLQNAHAHTRTLSRARPGHTQNPSQTRRVPVHTQWLRAAVCSALCSSSASLNSITGPLSPRSRRNKSAGWLAVLAQVRMRLGEFDPVASNPYRALSLDLIESAHHQRLAREARAVQSKQRCAISRLVPCQSWAIQVHSIAAARGLKRR